MTCSCILRSLTSNPEESWDLRISTHLSSRTRKQAFEEGSLSCRLSLAWRLDLLVRFLLTAFVRNDRRNFPRGSSVGMTCSSHSEEEVTLLTWESLSCRLSFTWPLDLLVRFLLTSFVRNDIVSAINSLAFIVTRTVRNDRSYLLIMVRSSAMTEVASFVNICCLLSRYVLCLEARVGDS